MCIQFLLLILLSTRPAPPPEGLRANLKWTEYILLFRLVPGKVAAKNSSTIILSNSLLGHTYVFSRELRQLLSRLKEWDGGRGGEQLHKRLNSYCIKDNNIEQGALKVLLDWYHVMSGKGDGRGA